MQFSLRTLLLGSTAAAVVMGAFYAAPFHITVVMLYGLSGSVGILAGLSLLGVSPKPNSLLYRLRYMRLLMLMFGLFGFGTLHCILALAGIIGRI